jgi:hypothetical protein
MFAIAAISVTIGGLVNRIVTIAIASIAIAVTIGGIVSIAIGKLG